MDALRQSLAALALAAFMAGAAAQPFTMKRSTPTINDVSHEWLKAFKSGVEARSGAVWGSA